tara:strand:+ start:17215 stop:18357 length:1143 start_codon:yes stop_codon:yes gene_type:complete
MNFLVKQYIRDNKNKIKHNYLSKQFYDYKKIFKKIEKVIKFGDYTLGNEVKIFENGFKKLQKSKYAIAVGSGTDAIMLSLKALGIKEGDEVITTPFTFYATINAIVTSGAKPIYVDIADDFNIDPNLIEKKITKKTKAIVPVHWTGRICDMKKIKNISKKYNLKIVEDACHSINAHRYGVYAGNFGDYGCFSMHPLKNLNIWGDGGVVVTNNKKLADKMYLLRNHGLINRDTNKIYGYNSRLDTIQAVVANHLLKKINIITNSRIKNAKYLDKNLKELKNISVLRRDQSIKEVFHIYSIKAKKRDKLVNFLRRKGIDAKIHYPKPMHLQPASKTISLKSEKFPKAEKACRETFSLPVHEFIKKSDLDYMINNIKNFYNEN